MPSGHRTTHAEPTWTTDPAQRSKAVQRATSRNIRDQVEKHLGKPCYEKYKTDPIYVALTTALREHAKNPEKSLLHCIQPSTAEKLKWISATCLNTNTPTETIAQAFKILPDLKKMTDTKGDNLLNHFIRNEKSTKADLIEVIKHINPDFLTQTDSHGKTILELVAPESPDSPIPNHIKLSMNIVEAAEEKHNDEDRVSVSPGHR